MVPTSTSQLVREEEKLYQPVSLFHKKVSTEPCLSGHALKLENKSPSCMAQACFKLLSLLNLGAGEFVCKPFKSRLSVSYSTLDLLKLSPTDF